MPMYWRYAKIMVSGGYAYSDRGHVFKPNFVRYFRRSAEVDLSPDHYTHARRMANRRLKWRRVL